MDENVQILKYLFVFAILSVLITASFCASPTTIPIAEAKKTQKSAEQQKDFYVLYSNNELKYGTGTPHLISENDLTALSNLLGDVLKVKDNGKDVNKKLQEFKDKLESILAAEDEKKIPPLSEAEQKQIEKEDLKSLKSHAALNDKSCKKGDVLNGAENRKDLEVLSKCELAVGIVKHTKKMDDGDYKFLLKVDNKYKFLLNDKNQKKTGGYLVVEIVPKDQDSKNIKLPKSGDRVKVWGSWVTDKPKGWHEIHPAWKVQLQS